MTTLRRAVSRWQVVALALNGVIGSGVYLLPAAAAALLGPASLWAVMLAGGVVLLANASWTNLLAGAAAAAIGVVVYSLRRP